MISRTSELDSLLSPRSVAVVGASENPDKVGGRPVRYMTSQGYAGRVYPINPRAKTIQGVRAFPSLDALPEVPDVAILCIGADQAEAQLALCGRLGVGNAILLASGFAEVGAEGRARQQRLTDICRAGKVRLLGPNTIGVANFATGAVLSFGSIYGVHPPQNGPVAVVSQSGGIGACAYDALRSAGWGVCCVATTGNEADIDTADFIATLARQDGVGVILVYLEDVKDREKLSAALRQARQQQVPVIALRAGRTGEGRRSAGLHTGSTGAADSAIDTIFDAADCRTVVDLDELVASVPLYLGAAWSASSASRPPEIVLISNSGAGCVLATDEAIRQGRTLATLSPASCRRLDEILPDFSLNRNPIDLTAALLADSALLGNVIQCVLTDPAVDAGVLGLLATVGPSYDVERFARDARAAAERFAKPLAVYSPHERVRGVFAAQGHAVYGTASKALDALEGFHKHHVALRPQALSAGQSSPSEPTHA